MSALNEKPTADRLKAGAVALGNLWRAGERCDAGWSLDCCQKETKFCKAKLQWLLLAVSISRRLVDGEFGLAISMNEDEWDLTKLTMNIEIARVSGTSPKLKGEKLVNQIDSEVQAVTPVGAKCGMTMVQLGELSKDPESACAVLTLLGTFAGSKMELLKEGKKS